MHTTKTYTSSSIFSSHGLFYLDFFFLTVYRYLIPCNHMMLSQRPVVRERDFYSTSASKILALTPSCCSPDRSPPPLRQLDSILFSKGSETPSSAGVRGRTRDKKTKDDFFFYVAFRGVC